MKKTIDLIYKKNKLEDDDFEKAPMRIAATYVLFGCFWILFSDGILNIFIDNVDIYTNIQTFKGWFFVFLTGVLIYNLIWKYFSKIKELNMNLVNSKSEFDKNLILMEEKNIEMKRATSVTNDFFMLMTKVLKNSHVDDEMFLREVFRIAFNLVKECNFGSAYIVENGKIKYIEEIGFHQETLKNLEVSADKFEFAFNHIKIKNYPEYNIKKRLNNDDYEEYSNNNIQIKQSVYVGISNDDSLYGGFSLDISSDDHMEFTHESIRNLEALQQLVNGFYKIKKINDQKNLVQRDIVQSFISALELHDEYTKGHSEAVASYSLQIGKKLNLDDSEINDLYWAATVHDIGKIIIPSSILNKKDKLTKEEYELVKSHTQIGYDILSKADTLREVSKYVLLHHERWDGDGYPKGLKGDEIPLISQIICVADSWHAMISDRPYKRKITKEEGLEDLKNNRGTQFSPKIVDVFLEILLKETN
ncbi:MAG: HD-GYP domain-containing protein [Anaeromicrobium sp.]|jgi:HD-GYP domain-containing protein (c-di-GMP phosphodiesterase class II)|uniref:HD-GYP domain-containing protein n=1 Tax=Anaeromicrobium sp. TaxID=1929132 RepID=UPI0025D09587|nr:HD-GYP domain-containing protein [Anaeromicrobium sp.]MCT4592978.1 HD-GYP domain-containing protein [Anaeromicrobium sp.]